MERLVTEGNVNIEPVDVRGASETVRLRLIDMIESGRLAIGDRLPSEAELAKAFRVSRTVIREALHSLKALGMTESYAGKGTFVVATKIQSQLISAQYLIPHLNEVRLALEVPCARLAAVRRKPALLKELRSIETVFEKSADPTKRVKVDSEFHGAVARCTGNPLFENLIDGVRAVLEEEALAVSGVPGRSAQAAAEHREIIAAIAARDADRAEAAVRTHLSHVDAVWSSLNADTKPPKKRAKASRSGAGK
jgi:GntR family transcriptional regulator, transcriptional repressor for pyruvate dehydrogenase complex